MLYAAASAEPVQGWGGPAALLIAFIVFRMLMPVMRKLRDKIGNPSPPPALPRGHRAKRQATAGFTDDEPDRVHDWGRISYDKPTRAERWRILAAQARQVVTTGSSELPPDDDEPDDEDGDLEIDLALDGDEPGEAEERVVTAEEYIHQARDSQVPYGQIVRMVMRDYVVSKSTAKRRISEVDEARRSRPKRRG